MIDIDRSHTIGRYDKVKNKTRPITLKFASYNVRGRAFREKMEIKRYRKKYYRKPYNKKDWLTK